LLDDRQHNFRVMVIGADVIDPRANKRCDADRDGRERGGDDKAHSCNVYQGIYCTMIVATIRG